MSEVFRDVRASLSAFFLQYPEAQALDVDALTEECLEWFRDTADSPPDVRYKTIGRLISTRVHEAMEAHKITQDTVTRAAGPLHPEWALRLAAIMLGHIDPNKPSEGATR